MSGQQGNCVINLLHALLLSNVASGVLLKMEVGIRTGRGKGPEGTLLIYDR